MCYYWSNQVSITLEIIHCKCKWSDEVSCSKLKNLISWWPHRDIGLFWSDSEVLSGRSVVSPNDTWLYSGHCHETKTTDSCYITRTQQLFQNTDDLCFFSTPVIFFLFRPICYICPIKWKLQLCFSRFQTEQHLLIYQRIVNCLFRAVSERELICVCGVTSKP